MASLRKLTRAVWTARNRISFGGTPEWNSNAFLQKWVNEIDPTLWANKPGWYWIETSLPASAFAGLKAPMALPEKAIRFNEIAAENLRRFESADLNAKVVYSGQEARVFTRLRLHFSLSMANTGTGALGISSYPLSQHTWHASFFHSGMISSLETLSEEERNRLAVLSKDKHSRDLVETCWRIEYGWPILCQR